MPASHDHSDWPSNLIGRQRDAITRLARWLIAELQGDPFTLDVLPDAASPDYLCDTLATFALMVRHFLVRRDARTGEFTLADRTHWLVKGREKVRGEQTSRAKAFQLLAADVAAEPVRALTLGRNGAPRSVRFDGCRCHESLSARVSLPVHPILIAHDPGHQLAAIALSHRIAAAGYLSVEVLSAAEYADRYPTSRRKVKGGVS